MTNRILRIVLAVWIIGYIVIFWGGLLTGVGLFGQWAPLAGVVFLIPWLIGLVFLVIMVRLANPQR